MYLVMMCQWNRVTHVKAFENHPDAAKHADELVMSARGINISPTFIPLDAGTNWEDGDYRQVYETDRGIAVMIEPCDKPIN